jgi:hypothetical protein
MVDTKEYRSREVGGLEVGKFKVVHIDKGAILQPPGLPYTTRSRLEL